MLWRETNEPTRWTFCWFLRRLQRKKTSRARAATAIVPPIEAASIFPVLDFWATCGGVEVLVGVTFPATARDWDDVALEDELAEDDDDDDEEEVRPVEELKAELLVLVLGLVGVV